METNKNEDTAIQNLCATAKAVLREKFITIQALIKNWKNSNIKGSFAPKRAG